MFDRLSKLVAKWARPGGEEAHEIYQAIAGHARNAAFYTRYGIDDTFDGRFDTLTLMSVLVFRRIKAIGDRGNALGQEVMDVMFADMDLSLHEIGVSENKVSKKIKTIATAFMGRRQAYIDALDAQDDKALSAALARNLYRDNGTDPSKNGLVKAIKAQVKVLDAFPDDALLKGELAAFDALINA